MKTKWSEKQIECSWDDAISFTEELNAEKYEGRVNWRVPRLWELKFAYKTRVSGFNVSECNYGYKDDEYKYWSSCVYDIRDSKAYIMSFKNGYDYVCDKGSYGIIVRYISSGNELVKWEKKSGN